MGTLFKDTALAVEVTTADKDLMGLELDLARVDGLAFDIFSGGKSIPAQEELKRWGMQQSDVNESCKELKDRHFATRLKR